MTEMVVVNKRPLADGVLGLDLRRADGADLPPWAPGAHVDLVLGNGLVRQYSLCGDPADRAQYRIAVLREPDGRGGSAYVHGVLAAGDRVTIRGPRNHFPLVPAPGYLFVAGGIGITPIRPMLAAAQQAGTPWRLVYGGRTRVSMAFRDELAAFGACVSIRPQDETGLLDLPGILASTPADTAVYCCGPEPLLAAIEGLVPPGALHVERFAPRAEPDAGPDLPFEVELARSGLSMTVPAGCSILRAAEEAGVDVLSSCQEGTCGTCETAVLDGVPDHRDSILSPAERETADFMMICVSRARTSRLVLDL